MGSLSHFHRRVVSRKWRQFITRRIKRTGDNSAAFLHSHTHAYTQHTCYNVTSKVICKDTILFVVKKWIIKFEFYTYGNLVGKRRFGTIELEESGMTCSLPI